MAAAERRVALDTSVVVAALLSVHEHHAAAAPFVAALRRSAGIVLPLPALIESYAVLTRLPTPLRLDRRVVNEALRQTFERHAEIPGLDGAGGWALLAMAVAGEVVGGTLYDLHIATCAKQAGASELATFNRRHFERFELGGIRLVVPGQGAAGPG